MKDEAEYAYFAGCTASFVENDIAIGAVRMLDDAGIEFTGLFEKEACCGIPMLVAGKWDVFEKIMRMNVCQYAEKRRENRNYILSCLLAHVAYCLSAMGRKTRNRIRT